MALLFLSCSLVYNYTIIDQPPLCKPDSGIAPRHENLGSKSQSQSQSQWTLDKSVNFSR